MTAPGTGGHQPPKPLDPDLLWHQHHREKLSLRVMARRLDCSHQHVANEMRRHGIPIRSQPAAVRLHGRQKRRHDLDPRRIAAAYGAGATSGELAEAYGVSEETIRQRLAEAGVEPDPAHKRPPTFRPDLDDEVIVADYRAGLSLRQVAERHGTTHGTVRSRLLAQGEPLRSRGRATMKGKKEPQ